MTDFNIYYRTSSLGSPMGRTSLIGTPMEGITKQNCFNNFIDVYGIETLNVIADNCNPYAIEYIKSKGINPVITNLGNNRSFIYALDLAINNAENDDDIIMMQEDDYLHLPEGKKYIREGLDIADYLSLYDNPDKFLSYDKGGDNILITDNSEETRVYLTKSSHWKLTNSTCMSFSARVKTLKEDYNELNYFCQSHFPHPMDFALWCFLKDNKKRKLITPLPGRSAHVGLQMSPLINWKEVLEKSK